MSAEIENGKEDHDDATKKEVEVQQTKRPMKAVLLDYWQIGIKILELLLASVCLGFIYDPAKSTSLGQSHLHHVAVLYTAYTGQTTAILVLLLSRIIGDRIPYKTMAMFAAVGAILYVATGTLLIADRAYLTKHYFFHPNGYLMEMLIVATIATFANAVVFIVDAALTFRWQQDF